MNARNNWSLFYRKKKRIFIIDQTLLDIDEFLWNYHITKYSISRKSRMHFDYSRFRRGIVSIRDRESDRSIDRSITFAATMRWTGTKKNRGKKTERRTKKKKKKRIELFLHDRSLEKSSLFARCLSLSLWKKKLILFLRVNDQVALDISPYKTRFEHFYQIRKREHWTEK